MSECNQHFGGSAGRQILLLKMNCPEGLCLAKVRVVPKTTGSRGTARYRGMLLTPACWIRSVPIWNSVGQYDSCSILEQGKGQSVSVKFE